MYDTIIPDVDGVLTYLKSSWKNTHEYFNVQDEAKKHYQSYKNNEINFKQWVNLDIGLWPKFTKQMIIDSFDDKWINKDAITIINKLKENYKIAALSIGPAPIIQHVTEKFQIPAKYNPWLFNNKGKYIGLDETRFFKDKHEGFLDLTKELKTDPRRVITIGDTIFDRPAFELAGLSIAINCDDDLVNYADYVVNSWDEILLIIESL